MNNLKRASPIRQGLSSPDTSHLPPVRSRTRGGAAPNAVAEQIASASNDNRQTQSAVIPTPQSATQVTKDVRGKLRQASRSIGQPANGASALQSGAEDSSRVGYGRPPKRTRFKKGQSGNPKGRAKGSRNLKSLYREERDTKVQVTENGRRKLVTKGAIAVKTLFSNVAKGQTKAFDQVLKLESLYEAHGGSGTAQNSEASADLPLPDRDAELLDMYFAARLAAMKASDSAVKKTAGQASKKQNVVSGKKRRPKSDHAEAPSNDNEPDVSGEPVENTPPPQRHSFLNPPLRAIKDD